MPPTASAPNLPKNPPSTTGAAPTNPGPMTPADRGSDAGK
jgi:hypothetical protein